MLNLDALTQYAELHRQIKALTEQQKALKGAVITTLEAAGPIESEGFQFRLKARKKWSYPEVVAEAEQLYKAEKLKAEASGDATFTETPYIECKLKDG